MGKLPKIKYTSTPPWRKVGEAEPEDCTTMLIRVYYKSARTGRLTTKFEVYLYMARFAGVAVHEKVNRHLGLIVTHWMPIPPIK